MPIFNILHNIYSHTMQKQLSPNYSEISERKFRMSKQQSKVKQRNSKERTNVNSPKGMDQTNLLSINRNKKKLHTRLSASERCTKEFSPQKSQQSRSSKADSFGPSNGSAVHDETLYRFESIALLTEQQNENLKQQNQYLIEKLRKMQERETKILKIYQKAKTYKKKWEEAELELEVLKEQCDIYKRQAEEMKKIALIDVYKLKQKVIQSSVKPEEDVGQQKQRENQSEGSGYTNTTVSPHHF